MRRSLAFFIVLSFILTPFLWAEEAQVVVPNSRISEEISAQNIQRHVLSFPGVRAVAVDVKHHEATVTYDADQITEERVRQLIAQAP